MENIDLWRVWIPWPNFLEIPLNPPTLEGVWIQLEGEFEGWGSASSSNFPQSNPSPNRHLTRTEIIFAHVNPGFRNQNFAEFITLFRFKKFANYASQLRISESKFLKIRVWEIHNLQNPAFQNAHFAKSDVQNQRVALKILSLNDKNLYKLLVYIFH